MKNSFKIINFFFSMLVIALAFAALGMPETFGAVGIMIAAPLVLANIKTSDDARQQRSEILDQMQELVTLKKDEKRSWDDDEQKRYDAYKKDIEKLDSYIEVLEADEQRRQHMADKLAKKTLADKEKRQLSQYSIAKVVRAGVQGKALDGLEAEMAQEARSEAERSGMSFGDYAIPDMALRSMSATGQTTTAGDQGGDFISVEKSGLIMALEPRLVLAQLGAVTMGNLYGGNLDIPGIGAVTSKWEGEVDETDEGSPNTSLNKISPKRIATITTFSKQLAFQADYNVESILRELIFRSIAQKVEKAAINGGGTGEPKGILATTGVGLVVGGDNGDIPDFADIVELETKVASENADIGSLGYLTNAKVRGLLKQTLKAANVPGFIFENNEMNGYRAGVTNLVPSDGTKGNGTALSSIVFGNFQDLLIANWAGIDLVFDKVTLAGKAQNRLIANTWWDALVTRPESFSKMIDAKTE